MRNYDDPWWESSDEDGNPEFSAYGPKEEPDCPPCGDTGNITRRGRRRQCPSCNPTRLDALLTTILWRHRQLKSRLCHAARRLLRRPDQQPLFDDESPF